KMITKNLTYGFNCVSIVFFLSIISCASQPPVTIGLRDGKLTPCPNKPNCVSSDHKGKTSEIEPLSFRETPEKAWKNLKLTVTNIGGKIEKDDNNYLWATFRTKLFRFVDDMEFRMDVESKVIHLRSASRVGYSDMGVNKRRVEKLRSKFYQENEK
ncbi:MAG: DUF1499 domain-containing protein, partial [Desulfobacterales bacterium]|nr:DUF1499 domain-containing protein [Desulfobacterales bacterium]